MNMSTLNTRELVPFSRELDHIKTYLFLEQLRFGAELQVVMDIGTTDFMLPALTVQPLVENAVKWGIGKREDGGAVRLTTRMTPLGVEGLRAALSGEPKGHGIVIDARGLEYLCPAAAEVLVLALSLPDLFAPESVAAAGGSMEVLKIVAYKDSHHIPTWVSVAKRLSSSDYFYPDGSPFCHSSRSSSNDSRSACLRHIQSCSNETPPIIRICQWVWA